MNLTTPIFFAIPGDLNQHTGGYAYDRRLITELTALGIPVEVVQLSGRFPQPTPADLAEAEAKLANLPQDAILLADCLAFGVMEEVVSNLLSQQKNLHIIALCHHPLALETGLSSAQQAAYRISEARALGASKAILVTSHTTAHILKNEFGIANIYVALPGTDRQNFAPAIGNPPILLTVASLTRRKAHDLLIDALATLSHLPWQARFVGAASFDPEWARLLHQKVADYGLEQRVLFLGDLANTQQEYANADLFVLPSHYEGYGMAFAEALAFGLPIIAARAGAVPELVTESAGILITPGDVQQLANALNHLLTNEEDRKRLQTGAQQLAENLPSWGDTALVVAGLIKQLS